MNESTETIETIEGFLRQAYLPALLTALAHATGDLAILRDELKPDPARGREPQGGLNKEQRATARRLAADALHRLHGGARSQVGHPAGVDDLRRMMAFTVGEPVSDDYLPLLLEELSVDGSDMCAPAWHKDDIAPERPFRVAIIGAGMSGLVAAHRLQQAGVDCIVIERNTDVGGTWFDNSYPGCRVDVPNHLYSYSFAQRQDWPHRFSTQDALLDYFRTCAHDLGIRERIRFGTEVVEARFEEETAGWVLTVRGPEGAEESLTANLLISAVGQLNRPKIPEFAGRERFAGTAFHSARWDHSVDLAGKRVAVIGTAASAIQLIPLVADQAAALSVFQRTPNWFLPTPEYHDAVPEGMQWLLRHVPYYSEWYRFSLFWRLAEGALPAARVDPEWVQDGRSVSARNDELRVLLTAYLRSQFTDRPDLLDRVIPDYPPLAKRILLDNGTWPATLKRENVSLVTSPIECITETGIETADGRHHDVDVIVYATGFQASEFLTPMKITGRNGIDLHEQWKGSPHAYLGMTIPSFPNLLCLYGPNTNLVANGSIIFFSECEVSYVLGCVRLLLEREKRALDCLPEIYEAYNGAVDEGNARMVWGASSVNTWYKNADGRVTQNWPFSLLEFWQRTRRPDPADFELI